MKIIELVIWNFVVLSGLSFAGLLFCWSYQMAVEGRNDKKLAMN